MQTGVLGHKLDERRTRAVVVDERVRSTSDTAFVAADMHHLARVLFHMDARDAHVRHIAVFGRGDVALAFAWLRCQIYASFALRADPAGSRWPRMQNATGPCVVWKFFAISGYI